MLVLNILIFVFGSDVVRLPQIVESSINPLAFWMHNSMSLIVPPFAAILLPRYVKLSNISMSKICFVDVYFQPDFRRLFILFD